MQIDFDQFDLLRLERLLSPALAAKIHGNYHLVNGVFTVSAKGLEIGIRPGAGSDGALTLEIVSAHIVGFTLFGLVKTKARSLIVGLINKTGYAKATVIDSLIHVVFQNTIVSAVTAPSALALHLEFSLR